MDDARVQQSVPQRTRAAAEAIRAEREGAELRLTDALHEALRLSQVAAATVTASVEVAVQSVELRAQCRAERLMRTAINYVETEGIENLEWLLEQVAPIMSKCTAKSRREWNATVRRVQDDLPSTGVMKINLRENPPLVYRDLGGHEMGSAISL